jgi:iron complex outermembrane recepter protein
MTHLRGLSNRFTKFLLTASSLALLAPIAAEAQEVETVTVTAERHSEDLQDVPVSVDTLTGDQLNAIYQSGEDIKALANNVPGLYAESSNGRVAPRFYIRGLGNTDFDLAASQPVSIIMDDVVMENTVLKSAPIYDQENVEVDRGPQGTLFGRNTTAGIVKFTSVAPTDTLDGFLTGSYGELGSAIVQGAVGDGITDTLSFRVSGEWVHRDNYIDNGYTGVNDALGGYDQEAARAQLLFKPSDDFSVLLNVHGWSLAGTAAVFRANIIGPGNDHINSNYIWNKVWFDGGFVTPTSQNNPQAYNTNGAGLTTAYDFDGVKLTSITGYEFTHGYSRGDIDGGVVTPTTTYPGTIFFDSESQDGLAYLHQFTEELHLASDTGSPLFWQVGALYFSTDYEDLTYTAFGAGAPPPTGVHQSNVSDALFGQASYAFTDAFKVTGGVRWTSDVKFMDANIGGVPITTQAGQTLPVKTTGDNVSWDLSLEYAASADVNLYARIATGFRAPSIQGRNLAFGEGYSTARSEKVESYEAGIKTELFDNAVRLNMDGYTYYLRDPQFSAIGGASNSVILENARAGLAYGLESDTEWAATDNLLFTLGASWTHTEIHDPALKTAVCAQCTITNPEDGMGNAYVNGNPFPQAPDYQVSLTAHYTYPLANGGALFAYTNWWIQGYTNFFLYKSEEFHSNGNYEGDLRLGYDFPNKMYEVAVYAENITDKENLQGAIDFDDNTGFVSDPRIIGVEFTVRTQ